jgi:hypothetical protein
VLGLALSLETVDLVHVVGLVVATVKEDTLGVQPLVGKEGKDDLDRPRTTVHKVAIEHNHVVVRRRLDDAEEVEDIVELAVG